MMKQVKVKLPRRMFALLCGFILSASAFAQQITVNGHVKDATGEPVIGATVNVGGKNAAVTDVDGNFTLTTAAGTPITVSYIVYANATANASANMTITMQDDTKTIEQAGGIG